MSQVHNGMALLVLQDLNFKLLSTVSPKVLTDLLKFEDILVKDRSVMLEYSINLPGGSWYAYFGLTDAGMNERWNNLTAQGYRLADISVVENPKGSGVSYYTAIFDKGATTAWLAYWGRTPASFKQDLKSSTASGYHLKHVHAYQLSSSTHYAYIFDKAGSITTWSFLSGLVPSEYNKFWSCMSSSGLRPVEICGYYAPESHWPH